MLVGSFALVGSDFRIDARLVATDTSEVLLARQVTGVKDKIFELEAQLAESLLKGLNAPLSPEALTALRRRQADFDAFRLYSEALIAGDAGRTDEATARLRQVLARNADFDLARRSLNALEAAALTNVSELEKQRLLARSRSVRRVQTHLAKQEEIIKACRFDPAYFAAIVIASAHAGLVGNSEREGRLLVRYWNDYAEHVPPQDAFEFFEKVNRIVAEQGKFFQQQVDNGQYTSPEESIGPPDHKLKPSLRNKLHWPKYAVISPFGKDARFGFNVAQATQETMEPWAKLSSRDCCRIPDRLP